MIERKTVTITRVLGPAPGAPVLPELCGSEWYTAFPQVPFIPNEVIVKSISVLNNGANDYLFEVYSGLVNEIIFTYHCPGGEGSSQAYDLHFALNRPIGGNYFFRARDATTGAVMNDATVNLSFQLEFVKYS